MHDRQRDKCLKVASEMLGKKKSVTIGTLPSCFKPSDRGKLNLEHSDNTNADHETRAVWMQLAHKFAVPIRCIYFPAPAKLCQHNDTIRALSASSFNPEKRSILPHSAFVGFTSRFKEPKVTEGFQDVIEVEFQVHFCLIDLIFASIRCADTDFVDTQFQGDEEQRRIWSLYWI